MSSADEKPPKLELDLWLKCRDIDRRVLLSRWEAAEIKP